MGRFRIKGLRAISSASLEDGHTSSTKDFEFGNSYDKAPAPRTSGDAKQTSRGCSAIREFEGHASRVERWRISRDRCRLERSKHIQRRRIG